MKKGMKRWRSFDSTESANEHAICNIILKKQQNVIDATTFNPPKVPSAITPTLVIDSMQELPSTPSSEPFILLSTSWPTFASTSGTPKT